MRTTIQKPMKREILLYALIVLFLSLGTTNIAIAPPLTKIYIDPGLSIAAVDQTFTVNVTVSNVVNLLGFEFKLSYNTTVLANLEVGEGPFMKQFGEGQSFVVNKTTESLIWFASVFLAGKSATGNGALASIKFKVLTSGSSPLHFNMTKLGTVANPEYPGEPHEKVDGYFGKPIFIMVSPASVTVGSNVTISGGIYPIAENEDVYIEYKKEGEATWHSLATRKTDANGAYSYTWTTTEGGIFKLRARWSTETSDEVTVTVETPSPFNIVYIAAAVIVIVAVVAAIYFLKLRKPK